MMNADTSYPLLVIQNDDGRLGVADGLNRMKKAIDVEIFNQLLRQDCLYTVWSKNHKFD
jgi:hypothetical protein